MGKAWIGNRGRAPWRALRALLVAFLLPGTVAAAPAEPGPAELRLFEAVGLDALLDIIREESVTQGRELGTDMRIAGQGALESLLAGIYAPARMRRIFAGGFAGRMSAEDMETATAFFASPLGARIVALEIAARAALLDPEAEAESRERAAAAPDADPDRLARVLRFIEVNALIDSNVVGSMNAQFAFSTGLASIADGRAAPMSEEEILADLWQQEPEIRRSSTEWLVSYLLLAYETLPDADLEAYIDFSATAAGQAYNRAAFAGFDALFAETWGRLGRGMAALMAGERL